MTDHTMHRGDRRSSPFMTSAAGPRLPARLRRRRALLVPPALSSGAFRTAP